MFRLARVISLLLTFYVTLFRLKNSIELQLFTINLRMCKTESPKLQDFHSILRPMVDGVWDLGLHQQDKPYLHIFISSISSLFFLRLARLRYFFFLFTTQAKFQFIRYEQKLIYYIPGRIYVVFLEFFFSFFSPVPNERRLSIIINVCTRFSCLPLPLCKG